MEWSLPYKAGLRFRELKEELLAAEVDEARVSEFLRGGQWDNFLTKYEESNHLHKRMLYAGGKVKQLPDGHQETSGALRTLYRSQCNCAYWHGLFGGLYLNYLRHALYSQIIAAENKADDLLLGTDRGLNVETVDFNKDGFEEVIVSNPQINAFISPARGGALMELDYRPACFNLSNVLRRRPEVYHQDILAAGKTKGGPEDPPNSIHDKVRVKEEGLEKKLVYDRLDRYSFMDHCLTSSNTFEGFKSGAQEELISFEDQPYQWDRGEDPVDSQAPFMLRLRRESVDDNSREKRLAVQKIYRFDPKKAILEVSYNLHNKGEKPLDFVWVVEHNFTLLAEDAPDRTYVLPDGELEDPSMASAGMLPDIQTLGMRDEFFGFELQLKYSPAVELWRFPVETVSQSEEGFESVYQGSCIAGCWGVQLEPGQNRQFQAGLGIKKL